MLSPNKHFFHSFKRTNSDLLRIDGFFRPQGSDLSLLLALLCTTSPLPFPSLSLSRFPSGNSTILIGLLLLCTTSSLLLTCLSVSLPLLLIRPPYLSLFPYHKASLLGGANLLCSSLSPPSPLPSLSPVQFSDSSLATLLHWLGEQEHANLMNSLAAATAPPAFVVVRPPSSSLFSRAPYIQKLLLCSTATI